MKIDWKSNGHRFRRAIHLFISLIMENWFPMFSLYFLRKENSYKSVTKNIKEYTSDRLCIKFIENNNVISKILVSNYL
jgi:hypothetical protein